MRVPARRARVASVGFSLSKCLFALFSTEPVLAPLRADIQARVSEVIDRGRFILGPEVEAFERELAAYLGARHVVSVANGTDAITIALRALGIQPEDEVVVPSFTFYASAEAVVTAGATPVFCDVDPGTRNVTTDTVRAALTPRTKAIVAVDLFGCPAPVPEISKLGLPVLEDAAQAIGATLDGRRAAALGDVATLSFYPSKNLGAFGDGGAIVTDDDGIAENARTLRFHGSRDKRTFSEVGYNSRLDEIQAAVLRVLLPHLEDWSGRRRKVASAYADAGLGRHLTLPEIPSGVEPAWHLYVAAHPQADDLIEALVELGIEARGYYRTPVHRQPSMRNYPRSDHGSERHRPTRAYQPRAPDGPGPGRRAGGRGGHGRRACGRRPSVKIWVDFTNSPHVLVLRPVIADLRARGHEVTVTARDFAQTLELCQRFGIEHTVIGRHRGGNVAAKAWGLGARSFELLRWARGRRFDLALGHGSNDVTVAAAALRIRSATMFDYEWAAAQHNVNCRLARAVVVPDAIPPERLYRYGARGKIRSYAGLKEEYYLADFEPDPGVLDVLGLKREQPIVMLRTAPAVSLYHRFENDLFAQVLERVRGQQAVVLPRTDQQRDELERAGGFIVPSHAIDAQSLIAFADLVVSAGGTMNREAVALGTPVFTVFEGRPGAVDERLIAEGRLKRLDSPDAVTLEKRTAVTSERVRRDPAVLTDLLLSAASP